MIAINNVSKSYHNSLVLDEVSLTINPGEVYALLGKNGAGKTTLIRIMLNLISFDKGTVTLFEKTHSGLQADDLKRIGVVLDNLYLLEELNAIDFLSFMGKLYKTDKTTLNSRIDDLLDYFFEDKKDLKKPISGFSTGMKKKLAFCAAIIHLPDILIMDEPFTGLDPFSVKKMINVINDYRRNDRVIFVSSHDLAYVSKIATHIGVIDEGRLLFNDTLQCFTDSGQREIDDSLFALLHQENEETQKISWL